MDQNFYQQPQYNQPQYNQSQYNQSQYNRPQNPKKKSGFGGTVAKCIAAALIFGIVSGGVFTGVSYVGTQAIKTVGNENENNGGGSKDNQNFNSANGNLTSTGTDSGGVISPTQTGNAIDVINVSGVVQSVMPSIVAITNIGTVKYQGWFGQTQTYESESCGSGIVVAQDDTYLYIVTNNHVVADAKTLTVQFSDNSTVSAEMQGAAPAKDIAVIKVVWNKVDEKTRPIIKMATLGDSTKLLVGEPAIAIGNALGYGQSVTTGVISALGRSVTVTDQSTGTVVVNNNLIQTDAAINPGNSGGALLNAAGEVIGINSVKYSDTSVEGIGYAIPMTDAWEIVEQLIKTGKYIDKHSAYLGIQGQDISADVAQAYDMPQGVYVSSVVAKAAAAKAGLRKGDIITGLDDKKIGSMNELKAQLKNYVVGDEVTVHFYRMGSEDYEEKSVVVKLGSSNDVQ